jgi:hypothetical protein
MKVYLYTWILFCLASLASASESPFVGTYKGEDVVLEIQKGAGDQFTGTVMVFGESVSFNALEQEGALVGVLTLDDENIPFQMTVTGSTLTFTAYGESQILTKQSQTSTQVGRIAPGTVVTDTASALRVNGVVIEPERVSRFEQENGMQIPLGDFWYDKVSGAWGITGGPTIGFTSPGMDLGGPLKANASNGNTGVFINGRQLHLQDVLGLQSLGVPVQQGRWWVDHLGNFGIEGSTIQIGNLFQFSRGQGGAYQRSTAGGYIGGDGTTSYFFDPKTGSSVMTGP